MYSRISKLLVFLLVLAGFVLASCGGPKTMMKRKKFSRRCGSCPTFSMNMPSFVEDTKYLS